MKPVFYNIALAVGGSHYPDVGGQLLEQFGHQVVMHCMQIADAETAARLAEEFGIEQ
jgi:hypothetical protein